MGSPNSASDSAYAVWIYPVIGGIGNSVVNGLVEPASTVRINPATLRCATANPLESTNPNRDQERTVVRCRSIVKMQENEVHQRLRMMRNTLIHYAGVVAGGVIALVLVPILLKSLGATQYGIW